MARRDYLVDGGKLKCTMGTSQGEIIVTSQQKVKIKGKFKATNKDKTLKPPFFGACKLSSPNPPCSPVLQEWMQTSKKSRMGNKTFVMKDSKIMCSKGGMITVEDVGQKLVGTGKDEAELDKKYAKFQGEIIFANGYLSASLGGVLNALFDINSDEDSFYRSRGKNMNEHDKISDEDLITNRKLEQIEKQIDENKKSNHKDINIPYPAVELEEVEVPFPIRIYPAIPTIVPVKIKMPVIKIKKTGLIDVPSALKPVPWFSPENIKDTFWGYWNSLSNRKEATYKYAEYFNAGTHQHFLNGSHGLGSNAAHRLDHGIAQGYHWAKYQWGILPKKEVDAGKKDTPYLKSYTPAYKPVTVVMHSQGNAPGVGFALGVMKYAHELKYEKMPLNLIFLGVHQPKNLWGDEYEDFFKVKIKYYGVNKDFWDGDPFSPFYKRDKKVHLKFSNALSDLFNPKYHKLRHKRGIYEHLKKITNFDAIKKSAVQFTFANDRADLVCRDGDIPEIASACRLKKDITLYSVEFFTGKAPDEYKTIQGKEIIDIESGGQLVIPQYSIIPRKEVEKDKKTGEEKLVFWKNGDYRSIAKDWGSAFSLFKKTLKKHKLTWKDVLYPENWAIKELVREYKLMLKYRKMLYHYGRIQHADLYAHFSPVGLIHDKDVLKTKDFNDALGNENIWNRIKKAGEKKFYRVVYDDDDKTEEQKRIKADKYIKKESKKPVKKSFIELSLINRTKI